MIYNACIVSVNIHKYMYHNILCIVCTFSAKKGEKKWDCYYILIGTKLHPFFQSVFLDNTFLQQFFWHFFFYPFFWGGGGVCVCVCIIHVLYIRLYCKLSIAIISSWGFRLFDICFNDRCGVKKKITSLSPRDFKNTLRTFIYRGWIFVPGELYDREGAVCNTQHSGIPLHHSVPGAGLAGSLPLCVSKQWSPALHTHQLPWGHSGNAGSN